MSPAVTLTVPDTGTPLTAAMKMVEPPEFTDRLTPEPSLMVNTGAWVAVPVVSSTSAVAVAVMVTPSRSVMKDGSVVVGSIWVLVYLSSTLARKVIWPISPPVSRVVPSAACIAAPASRLMVVCPVVVLSRL